MRKIGLLFICMMSMLSFYGCATVEKAYWGIAETALSPLSVLAGKDPYAITKATDQKYKALERMKKWEQLWTSEEKLAYLNEIKDDLYIDWVPEDQLIPEIYNEDILPVKRQYEAFLKETESVRHSSLSKPELVTQQTQKSNLTPLKGTIVFDGTMTQCNPLAREARFYYVMCDLNQHGQVPFGGWWQYDAACTEAEKFRKKLSLSVGKDVLSIAAPPDIKDEHAVVAISGKYRGLQVGEPTQADMDKAIAEFTRLPESCKTQSAGVSPKNYPEWQNMGMKEREFLENVLGGSPTPDVKPGCFKTLTAEESKCNVFARAYESYSGFCQVIYELKKTNKQGFFPAPEDACQKAEEARQALSLTYDCEVVGVTINDVGLKEFSPSGADGMTWTQEDMQKMVDYIKQLPPECPQK